MMTLSLAKISYPPQFFTPENQDLDIRHDAKKICLEALICEGNAEHANAVKLYLKLIDNGIYTFSDLKSLFRALKSMLEYSILHAKLTEKGGQLSRQILNQHQFCQKGFSYSEIQKIILFCKQNSSYLLKENRMWLDHSIKKLHDHLDSNSVQLTNALKNITDNALLLLKAKKDENYLLSSLDQTVWQQVAIQMLLETIKEIGLTPVDISRSTDF